MPRTTRTKSQTGIYHIIMRGINRQCIFQDDEDCQKFIQTLQKYNELCGFKLFAYCLMGNHVHLLLMEVNEPLEKFMRRLGSSYVFWYNRKYNRAGYLFQDRFKSEPVNDERYFLTVLRYIFQNPVKAGLVKNIKEYVWSNYLEYIIQKEFTDIEYVLNIFHNNEKEGLIRFIEFINLISDDACMEMANRIRLNDDEARKVIMEVFKIKNVSDIIYFDKIRLHNNLKELKQVHYLSIRQIERLTGINRGVILNAK